MKKHILAVIALATALLLNLTSCEMSEGSVDPTLVDLTSDYQQTEILTTTIDSLTLAEEEFNSAIKSLSDVQTSLQNRISEAEELLETIAEDNVDDPSVLENLRDVAINATTILNTPIPEMESDEEEIQQQVKSIYEQKNILYNSFYDLGSAINQVKESQQRLVEANRSEIIMAKATLDNRYNYTIYAVDPETGVEKTISEFSIPTSVTANADGSKWQTYPMFIPSYNSRLSLRGMFSTDYNYIAVSRYSLETMEYRAGFYKEGEGLYYTDVTKLIGAVGGDFDDPTIQLALGFTDSNQFIFAEMDSAPSFFYNTENWIAYQVNASDTINGSSLQSYDDLDAFLMKGDNWNWTNESWAFTDWIDDTRCLINYPEESASLFFGGSRIDRWGVRIFNTVTQESSSIIPGESRSNWSGVISPDGESVAFLSAPKSGTGNAALYVTSIDGGEPVKILDDIPSGRSSNNTILTRPESNKTVYFLLEWRKPTR